MDKHTRRISKDVLVLVAGSLTSVVTAYCLSLVDTNLHFAIYGFSIWFVPVGAFFCGVIAATGYVVGFKLVPHQPTVLVKVGVVLQSAATYFLVYYVDYRMWQAGGRHISELLPFSAYFMIAVSKRSQWVMGGNLGSLGPINYLLAASQLVAFVFAGIRVARTFPAFAYCEECDRKLQKSTQLVRASNSLLELEKIFQKLVGVLASGGKDEALRCVSDPAGANPNGHHKLVLSILTCTICSINYFDTYITPGGEHVGRARGRVPEAVRVSAPA